MLTSIENAKAPTNELSVDQITLKLSKVVAREVEHLDSLLQLLTDQQRFLVEKNVAAVEENVQRQEQAISYSRELEAERQRLLGRLAERVDGNPRELTLSKLTDVLSGTYATRLKKMQQTMLSITGNIQHVRQQNEMLINRSLMHIRETMRLLAGSQATAPEYAPRTTTKNNAALVNRVG
jgi:hypothetical protein